MGREIREWLEGMVTVKSEIVNGYYIYIEQDEYTTVFNVGVYGDMYSYPLNERSYSTIEKAKRRFRDLKKRYV